jgi:hypothetical protein
LVLEYDEDEELVNQIKSSYSSFFTSSESGPELSTSLLKVLKELLGEDTRATRLLKACNQSIIAPAVTKLKKLMEDVGLPFNSVRNGWFIDIRRDWDVIVVSHRKREAATPEGEASSSSSSSSSTTPLPASSPACGLGIPYVFEWYIDFTIDEEVQEIKKIATGVRSVELPLVESVSDWDSKSSLPSVSTEDDEIEFRNLLSELFESVLTTKAPPTNRSLESRLKKIRTKRDKRFKQRRKKESRITSPAISRTPKQDSPTDSPSSSLSTSSPISIPGLNTSPTTSPPLSPEYSPSPIGGKKKKSRWGFRNNGSLVNRFGFLLLLLLLLLPLLPNFLLFPCNSKEVIDLSKSTIDEFPTQKLLSYPLIRELNLSSNFLISISNSSLLELKEVGFGMRLTSLFLDNNQLRTLPNEIGLLTRLQILSVRHNHLQELPLELSTLSDLTVLNLEDNRLRSLPREISELTKLTVLNLDSNPLLVYPPLKICKMGVCSVLSFLSADIGGASLLSSGNGSGPPSATTSPRPPISPLAGGKGPTFGSVGVSSSSHFVPASPTSSAPVPLGEKLSAIDIYSSLEQDVVLEADSSRFRWPKKLRE